MRSPNQRQQDQFRRDAQDQHRRFNRDLDRMRNERPRRGAPAIVSILGCLFVAAIALGGLTLMYFFLKGFLSIA